MHRSLPCRISSAAISFAIVFGILAIGVSAQDDPTDPGCLRSNTPNTLPAFNRVGLLRWPELGFCVKSGFLAK